MSSDTAAETTTPTDADNVRWFAELGLGDLEVVGGKNASLGEMISNASSADSAAWASSTVAPERWCRYHPSAAQ